VKTVDVTVGRISTISLWAASTKFEVSSVFISENKIETKSQLALTLPAPDQDGFHISLFCPLVVLSSSRTSVISFMSRNGPHDPWLAWCWLE